MFVRENNLCRQNLDIFRYIGDVLFIPDITRDETGNFLMDGCRPKWSIQVALCFRHGTRLPTKMSAGGCRLHQKNSRRKLASRAATKRRDSAGSVRGDTVTLHWVLVGKVVDLEAAHVVRGARMPLPR